MSHSTVTNTKSSNLKTYPCPTCNKLTVWQDNQFKPFCSGRCKLIDLGAWANEEYKVAAEEAPFSQDLDH